MPSPADRQAQAEAHVTAIAAALYSRIRAPWRWQDASESAKEAWRDHVRALLRQGLIRPPEKAPPDPPMRGQTSIDDYCS